MSISDLHSSGLATPPNEPMNPNSAWGSDWTHGSRHHSTPEKAHAICYVYESRTVESGVGKSMLLTDQVVGQYKDNIGPRRIAEH